MISYHGEAESFNRGGTKDKSGRPRKRTAGPSAYGGVMLQNLLLLRWLGISRLAIAIASL
jgi:hypothetical protein